MRVGAELAGDVLDQLAFERLVDGDEDALHQQGGDEVLAADVELFGEVLDADAFGDRDGLGDGQRLARDLRAAVTRRRLEALHRAFLGLLVALTAAALAGTCRRAHAGRRSFAGAGHAAGCSAGTCAEAGTCTEAGRAPPGAKPGRPGAPPGPPGPPGKVRVGCMGRRAPGAVDDGGREPGPPGACGRGRSKMGRPRCGGSGGGWRSGVDGARAGLRHDDAADGCRRERLALRRGSAGAATASACCCGLRAGCRRRSGDCDGAGGCARRGCGRCALQAAAAPQAVRRGTGCSTEAATAAA